MAKSKNASVNGTEVAESVDVAVPTPEAVPEPPVAEPAPAPEPESVPQPAEPFHGEPHIRFIDHLKALVAAQPEPVRAHAHNVLRHLSTAASAASNVIDDVEKLAKVMDGLAHAAVAALNEIRAHHGK